MASAGIPAPDSPDFAALIPDLEGLEGLDDTAAHALPALVASAKERGVRVVGIRERSDAREFPGAGAGAALLAYRLEAGLRGARVEPGAAVLITDSPAAVHAGRRVGCGLIVAVAHDGRSAALLDGGAAVVVASAGDVTLEALDGWFAQNTCGLPSALACWPELAVRLRGRRLAVFLDYDGTLAPIAEDPARAFLPEPTRDLVRQLAARCPVAIVSGRHRDKIMDFVGMDEVAYAGSHGFDISGPRGAFQLKQDLGLLAAMSQATAVLRIVLAGLPGVEIEDKGFSTAVHFRRAPATTLPEIELGVDRVLATWPELHKVHGKKVIELRPRIDWHKGRAVLWLLQALGLDGDDVLPIYVGDDVTDEDAFGVLGERGLCILVSERPRPSAAKYVVRDPDEVRELLARLVAMLEPGQPDGNVGTA